MNIGIDIDDTISKTFEYSYPLSKQYTKQFLNRESLDIENLSIVSHEYLKIINKWTSEEEDFFWKNNYQDIVKNVEPKEDVIEILKKLKQDGHNIFLITARYKSDFFDIALETKSWLDNYNIPYDDLVVEAFEKSSIAENKKIDIFIDDSFKNCVNVAEKGIESYLVDSFMNKGLENKKITRVFSWNEIYNKIKEKTDK